MKVVFEMDVKEEWKKIKGYPYRISNFGRVKRIGEGCGAHVGKILKPGITRGYLRVGLCKNNKVKFFHVHKLVAETFIGSCPKGKEVNHKDGDKENPYINNLEYVTRSQNMKHAFKLGLQDIKGEKNSQSKLTKKDIKKIRALYKTGNYIQKEIAKIFKVSRENINLIVNNKIWSHV